MLKVKEIIKLLDCEVFTPENLDEEKTIRYAFSADLMSDTLFILNRMNDSDLLDETILITGLATNQAIKSAEIIDIGVVLMVRGKTPAQTVIDQAIEAGIVLLSTKHTMFNSNGLLYEKNVRGLTKHD
ncbi:hypothetical protein LJC17_01770 [Acholeplasma sp. OttesenSCG-928-E16]|nr:hypothetical protein [Acholeplasma sp. OttesenSCG-928-E16]